MQLLKKKSLYISMIMLACIFIICSCDKNTKKNNNSNEWKDQQIYYKSQGGEQIMAESPEGYYFLVGNYLYYMDKKTEKSVILCSKPNCLHIKEKNPERITNCEAFYLTAQSISWNDGKLYVIARDTSNVGHSDSLYEVSPNGTERKEKFHLDKYVSDLIIHRGNCYYEEKYYDKDNNPIYNLCTRKLDGKSKKKIIYKGILKDGNIQDLICVNDKIYFTEFLMSEEKPVNINWMLDLKNGKTKRLFSNDDNIFVNSTITKKNIYYSLWNYKIKSIPDKERMYCSDLSGEKAKSIKMSTEADVACYADDKYIYNFDLSWAKKAKPIDEQRLVVFTKEGKRIASIKTGKYENAKIICGGDDSIFIKTSNNELTEFYSVAKKNFSKEDIEAKKIISISSESVRSDVKTKD